MKQTEYTAIVTGSTRGIGKETALLLLKNGMNVIISSKSEDSVDNAKSSVIMNVIIPSSESLIKIF